MREILVDRALPSAEASDALRAALVAVLGDKCSGTSARLNNKGPIRVHLADNATADDENTARQIVLNHDFTKRTEAQIERKKQQEALESARKHVDGGKATKDETIAYLLLEIKHLRERLGE